MAIEYLHGVETTEISDGVRYIRTIKSNVVGIVGTAPLADAEAFPLNIPVIVFGNVHKLALLGREGTLFDAAEAVLKQGSATIVIVRVAASTDNDAGKALAETMSNVIGSPITKNGIWALTKAKPLFGLTPRLLCAPGFTHQLPTNGIQDINVTAGGTGYGTTATVTITGDGFGARAVATLNAGVVTGITVVNPGSGYSTATVAISGAGTGATATAVLGTVANPVGIEFAAIVDRLRATAFIDGPRTTYTAAIDAREDYGSQRLMMIDPGVLVWNTTDSVYETRPASAYAAGLQARIDQEVGFWRSFSNNPIAGVGGISRPVDWALNDPNTEANQLNANEITTIINEDGFRFWGLRGMGSDPLWAFLSVRRTADMVYESLEQAMLFAMDREFSYQLLDDIRDSVDAYLRLLRNRGALIGGQCWIDPDLNTPATFASGELIVDFDIEPPAPLERLKFRAHRNPEYYNEFIETFARRAI
jgi:phage tail sheath protein FI